jgi:hypothetical protein
MLRFESKIVLWFSYHIRTVPIFFVVYFKILDPTAIIPGRQKDFLAYNNIKKHKICLYVHVRKKMSCSVLKTISR